MCFSAGASFTASIVIGGMGIATVKKTEKSSQLLFASIPLIFALQQFSEGLLWIALTYSNYATYQTSLSYVFLIFAQLFWPTWIPLSIYLFEKEIKRKRAILILLCLGISVSIYLTYCFFNYPIHIGATQHHINYRLDFPHYYDWFSGLFYIIPTIVPTFISSVRWMSFLGLALLFSYVITKIFFAVFVISVWCFFAASLSVVVLYILIKQLKSQENI